MHEEDPSFEFCVCANTSPNISHWTAPWSSLGFPESRHKQPIGPRYKVATQRDEQDERATHLWIDKLYLSVVESYETKKIRPAPDTVFRNTLF